MQLWGQRGSTLHGTLEHVTVRSMM